MEKDSLTDGSLVVRMQSTEIECSMCGSLGDHYHSVPWNGGPVSEAVADGCHKVVCEPCYEKWVAWDNRRSESAAIAT